MSTVPFPRGSWFSKDPLRIKPGKWVYRGFIIASKGWHWLICSGCGDLYKVKSLKAARATIDKWHAEGSVES